MQYYEKFLTFIKKIIKKINIDQKYRKNLCYLKFL